MFQFKWLTEIRKIYLIYFFGGMLFYLPIYTIFFIEHQVKLETILWVQAIYTVTVLIFNIPLGIVADKFGSKYAIITGYSLEIVGLLFFILNPNIWGLFIGNFMRGLGFAFIDGAEESRIYAIAKKNNLNYIKCQTNSSFCNVIGLCLSGIFASFFISSFKKELLYSLFVFSILANVICILLTLTISNKVLKIPIPDDAKKQKQQPIIKSLRGAIINFKNSVTLRTIIYISIFAVSTKAILDIIYQPLYSDRHVQLFWFGLTISIGSFLNGFLQFIYNYLYNQKRWSFRGIITFNSMFNAIMYIILALAVSPTLSVIVCLCLFSSCESTEPIEYHYIQLELNETYRNCSLSLLSVLKNLTQIGFQLLIPLIIGLYSFKIGIIFLGSYLLIGSIINFFLIQFCECPLIRNTRKI
ncbi:MAG: MFS transporter [Alphaproteobacteria bacterium]|nr:MFS transporter [Alphaproteobacteria bacterium]